MALDARWIWILLWLGVVLRRQHVHLGVGALSLRIDHLLVLQTLLLDALLLPLQILLRLGHETLLQLRWLWVKSIEVVPLLLKLRTLIPAH